MLNTVARVSGIGLAAGALALALAPAVQASTFKSPTRPVVQTTSFPTSYGWDSPCDGSLVATTGHGSAMTITDGQRTTAVISDFESGGGYEFIMVGEGAFSSL